MADEIGGEHDVLALAEDEISELARLLERAGANVVDRVSVSR